MKSKGVLKKMPLAYKDFFFYLNIYRDVYKKNKNAGIIIIGQTGSGKSYVALRIAQDLDPTFNIAERVVYSAKDFLNLLANKNLPRGSVIVFDEVAHDEGADSRSSLSKNNKIMSYVATTYRNKGLIVIFVLPALTQLDKNLRAISISAVLKTQRIDFKRKLCCVQFFWNDLNSWFGKAYMKKGIVKVGFDVKKVKNVYFGKPSKALTKEYDKKKNEFVDSNVKRWNARYNEDEYAPSKVVKSSIQDLANVIVRDSSKFSREGRVLPSLIMDEFNIGMGKAKEVARLVRLS